MFGQPQSSPFGSPPAPSGFGGAPAFGSPAPAPFGAPSGGFGAPAAPAFGSPAPAAPFGAPAPAAGGFGSSAFGSSANTFGGGGAFGAPAPAPAFGSTGGFGATTNQSPFGSPAPAPSGGLFGSAPAPSGGLFGAPAPSTGFGGASTGFGGGGGGFGAPAPSTGFGAPAPATGFGAPAPSTGLFGAPAPAPAFGSTGGFGAAPAPAFGVPAPAPAGGIFGAPAAPAGGGMFGAQPGSAGPAGAGTKGTPFNPTTRQDGTSSISMQSISAMAQYENKCFEELRYEDYMQGNKGSGSAAGGGGFGGGFGSPAPAPGGGLFGAPAPAFGAPPASGGFGAPAPGAFGAPAPGAFGAPAPGAFGAPAPGAFGASAPAPGGFGAPAPGAFGAPAPGAFGAPAPAPGGFGSTFGKPASGNLFGGGAPAPAPGGLFGSAPAPAFGAPAPTPGLFGSAPAPSGGLFGSPAPAPSGGLFGAPAPAPFGAPAPSSFGASTFGSPAPAPGLFGAPSPAPAFGAPAGGSLFGAPAPAPAGGMFGAPAPAGGMFGSPAPGGFGAPAPSYYGAQPAQAPVYSLPPAGSIIPQAANEVLAHQIQALENKRKEMQKLDAWTGKSPDSSSVIPASRPQYDGGLSSVVLSNSQYSPYRPSPRSTAKIRPRGFGTAPSSASASLASPALSKIGTGGRPMMSPEGYAASSVKRLVIKPDSMTPKPKMRLRLANSPANGDANTHALPVPLDSTSPSMSARVNCTHDASPSPMQTPRASSIPVFGRETPPAASPPDSSRIHTNGMNGGKTMASLEKLAPPTDPGLDYYQKVVGSPDGVAAPAPAPATQPSSGRKRPSYLPKLTKPGYSVTPSIDRLAVMSEADLATLSGFSVRRDPYGMVEWEGAVDVRNADLDASIVISQNDVSVYARDEEEGRKPPVGSKLNRPAVISFFNVFPKNGGASADEERKAKFAKKIERSTAKMEADLISYDKDRGIWKIRVHHFSRYGLDDDDDTDEEGDGHAIAPGGTPDKGALEDVDLWQDDELGMDDAAVVSDVEMEKTEEISIRNDAEAAYASIFDTIKTYTEPPVEEEEMLEDPAEDDKFDDDGEPMAEDEHPKRRQISKEDYEAAASVHGSAGICSRVAAKSFAGERRVPSSTDFGRRLGKSFRVGWSPDGSFLKLCPGGTTLKRCRPVFDDPATPSKGLAYLETHKANSNKVPTSVDDTSPRFVLPMGMGNSGNTTSHEALYQTISSYASNGEGIDKLAFSLLACLVDNEEDAQFKSRRKEAVVRFFVNACEASTDADILSAVSRGDVNRAIFAALSGGDLAKACNLAVEMGEENLAACISTFDAEGNREIAEQVRLATTGSAAVPDDLLTIYKLLSGDTSAGTSDLDWMRRFLIRLLYDNPRKADTDVSSALEAYNRDVKSQLSPYPSPAYRGAKAGVQCVLYRLLRLNENPVGTSCAEIINPDGCSRDLHDYSLAFHLASALAASGSCAPLPAWQEEKLIDGYVTQLIGTGLWHWAVYVCLVQLGDIESSSTDWKRAKAKSIVLQKYHLEDSHALERRHFLQEVGVPSEWLAEALAMRSASKGDPFETVGYLVAAGNLSEALGVIDTVILPSLFHQSQDGIERSLALLESFSNDLSPLSKAVLNLFALAKDVYYISQTPANHETKEAIPELREVLNEIESVLETEKLKGTSALKFWPSFDTIPVSAMLSEALEHVLLMRLQLKALESGIEIGSGGVSKNRLTALAWLAVDGDPASLSKFSKASVVRGLR